MELFLAGRALRRAPLFATLAILSVAIGIAANVIVFSIVDGLLLRPLTVPQPERLIRIGRSTRDAYFAPVSYPECLDLQATLAPALDLLCHYPNSATLTVDAEPRIVWLEMVSDNYFGTLGTAPFVGRGFLPNDQAAFGARAEIILSDRLWRSRFGASRDVLGKTATVNGHPFTIVGVAPASFHGTFTGFAIDAWVPASMQPIAVPSVGSATRREDRFLMLLGRLRPGISIDRARGLIAIAEARSAPASRIRRKSLGSTWPTRPACTRPLRGSSVRFSG